MASLKIKYRHSSIEGKAGTLFYQVIHNRVARQINSGYKIYPDEWDIFNSQIIIPAKTGENRHRYLVSLKKCIEEDTSRLINPAKRNAIAVKNEMRFSLQKRNVLQKSRLQSFRLSYPVEIQVSFKRLLKTI